MKKCEICCGVYPLNKHDFEKCCSVDYKWDMARIGKSVGSLTAINGYEEEEFMVGFLNIIGLEIIEKMGGVKKMLTPVKIKDRKKSDIQWSYNIQHKKTKVGQFGQVCRHWIKDLHIKIPMDNNTLSCLSKLCELPPNKKNKKMCDRSAQVVKLNRHNYSER